MDVYELFGVLLCIGIIWGIVAWVRHNKKSDEKARLEREAEKTLLIEEAENGNLNDQIKLVKYFQEQAKNNTSDKTDMPILYYWLWVLSYNGNKGATGILSNMITNYYTSLNASSDSVTRQMYANILEKIYQAEIDAYEDRRSGEKYFFVKGYQESIEDNHLKVKEALHALQHVNDKKVIKIELR